MKKQQLSYSANQCNMGGSHRMCTPPWPVLVHESRMLQSSVGTCRVIGNAPSMCQGQRWWPQAPSGSLFLIDLVSPHVQLVFMWPSVVVYGKHLTLQQKALIVLTHVKMMDVLQSLSHCQKMYLKTKYSVNTSPAGIFSQFGDESVNHVFSFFCPQIEVSCQFF